MLKINLLQKIIKFSELNFFIAFCETILALVIVNKNNNLYEFYHTLYNEKNTYEIYTMRKIPMKFIQCEKYLWNFQIKFPIKFDFLNIYLLRIYCNGGDYMRTFFFKSWNITL